MKTRKILALILGVALPLPAAAQTHVIAQLGTAPLIGQVASTPQLQNDMRSQQAVFEDAALQLGLTPTEFLAVRSRIERGQVTYVTIPRRLDAMSWRSGNRVHVLRDVVIPAKTMGWEVDLAEGGQTLAVFIPNKCGNLSLLRKPAPRLARAAKVLPADVSYAVPSPAPAPVTTPAPAPAPTAAPAQPMQVPLSNFAASTGTPAPHRFRAWPLLLLPIIAMFASHGHGGPSPIAPPIATGSVPPPAGCATPKP